MLSDRDLSGNDFSGVDLSGTDFTNSNLENSNFENANLEGAIFKRANMKNVKLDGASLGIYGIINLSDSINYIDSVKKIQDKIESKIDKIEIKEHDMSGISCYNKGISKTNPLDEKEIYSLINTKKKKYYIHRYDPSLILKKLFTFPHINEHFDLEVKNNCCNRISISLYFTERLNLDKCVIYLTSIRRTVNNVRKNLPDWLVRLYLDSSVYKKLMNSKEGKYKGYIKESLNLLLNAENVEIYTYCCPNILNGNIS